MNFDLQTRHTISPFDGEPYTFSTLGGSEPSLRVMICEITPEGAKRADTLTSFLIFLLFLLAIFILSVTHTANGFIWLAGIIAPALAHGPLNNYLYESFRKTTEVIFTPTEFRINTDSGWLIYDRTITHHFAMMKHDLARQEREQIERKIRRDQLNKTVADHKRYFDESYHILFMYMGQRIDVLTIYDQKRASMVDARLKACDKIMDTKNLTDKGEVLNPGDQWNDGPGLLPRDLF